MEKDKEQEPLKAEEEWERDRDGRNTEISQHAMIIGKCKGLKDKECP